MVTMACPAQVRQKEKLQLKTKRLAMSKATLNRLNTGRSTENPWMNTFVGSESGCLQPWDFLRTERRSQHSCVPSCCPGHLLCPTFPLSFVGVAFPDGTHLAILSPMQAFTNPQFAKRRDRLKGARKKSK